VEITQNFAESTSIYFDLCLQAPVESSFSTGQRHRWSAQRNGETDEPSMRFNFRRCSRTCFQGDGNGFFSSIPGVEKEIRR